MASPKVVLRRANYQQYRATLRNHAEQWRGELSVEDYITIEEAVSRRSAMAPGHATWILTPDDDPDTILASTECWHQTLLYAAPHASTAVFRHGLMFTALFVPPKARGKGYSSLLQGYAAPVWPSSI
jgi:hypothetical protein